MEKKKERGVPKKKKNYLNIQITRQRKLVVFVGIFSLLNHFALGYANLFFTFIFFFSNNFWVLASWFFPLRRHTTSANKQIIKTRTQ
jgi:hypothetical protein